MYVSVCNYVCMYVCGSIYSHGTQTSVCGEALPSRTPALHGHSMSPAPPPPPVDEDMQVNPATIASEHVHPAGLRGSDH